MASDSGAASTIANMQEAVSTHFGRAQVLVVGDLMLDRYLFGVAGRISQEAPVLVMRHQSESENPGGAGNVACNMAALGLSVRVIGLVGQDDSGARLLERLNSAGVDTSGIVHCPNWPTTTKSRVTSGRHQLLRIDIEETGLPLENVLRKLIDNILHGGTADPKAIILSDYAKGVITEKTAQAAIARGRQLGIPVLVDPKGSNWSKYRDATMASPNRTELAEATGESLDDLDRLLAAGERLRQSLELTFLAVTLGEQGIVLLDRCGMFRLPSMAREVFDVSGAGDTVIATTAAGLIAGLNRREALELANLAAGIVVGRSGTVPIDLESLSRSLDQSASESLHHKICNTGQAVHRARVWRDQGQRIIFTNGCFDLVHAGHALHLEQARHLGQRLIIGLNSDRSVRALKGDARPIQCERDRAILLASMACVDAVVLSDEPTPLNLVLAIRPDVMVKGSDYSKFVIAGAAEVESWGGEVVTLPLVEGLSTSAIIERIRNSN